MNPQNYAEAVWKAIERGLAPKDAMRNLVEMLQTEGRAALLPGILRALRRIVSRENDRQSVTLSVAKEEDLKHAEREVVGVLKEIGAEKSELLGKVEADLIGGWRLEGKGTLIDASFKKQLFSLYNRVTENNE